MEKKVLRTADRIIANTDYIRENLIDKLPLGHRDKVLTIKNGYDEAEFRDIINTIKQSSNPKFVISHIGEFYEEVRIPDNFLIATNQLLEEKKIDYDAITINFIGGGEYTNSFKLKKLLWCIDAFFDIR